MHFMDIAKGAVSDHVYDNLGQPQHWTQGSLGPSWSTWCCLVPWFLFFHSCHLLCASRIMWRSQERGEYSTEFGEAILGRYVLWHCFWLSLSSHLNSETGRGACKQSKRCVHFQEKSWRAISASTVERRRHQEHFHLLVPKLWEGCQ